MEAPITRSGKRKIAELDVQVGKSDEILNTTTKSIEVSHGVSGKRICVTGKFDGNIHEIKNLLGLNGAIVQSTVKNADFLLCGVGQFGVRGKKWTEAKDIPTCTIVDESWLSAEVKIQRKNRRPRGSFYAEETRYI